MSALLFAFGLPAQSRGASLAGTVFDQAGKAVPNATVAVKNEATGAVRTLTTDSDGRFSVADLSAGSYSIEASAAGFATSHRAAEQLAENAAEDITIPLSVGNVSQTITVQAVASLAAQLAPSGNTLERLPPKPKSADEFIKNFMSPVSRISPRYVNLAPGTFSLNPNGIGLGQGKTYFRGFQDGQYTMTFDGIPFEDTNTPTHHSWANFPAQWIGRDDFDRSPGLASNFGPTNFGGSINLLVPGIAAGPGHSRDRSPTAPGIRACCSWTPIRGLFGPGNKNSFLMDIQQLLSDGYQTYNYQKRVAGYGKYQYRLSDSDHR